MVLNVKKDAYQQIKNSFAALYNPNLKQKYKINDWSLWKKLVKSELAKMKINCHQFQIYCTKLIGFNQYYDLNNTLAFFHYLQLLHCKPDRICKIENQTDKAKIFKINQSQNNIQPTIVVEADEQDLDYFEDLNEQDLGDLAQNDDQVLLSQQTLYHKKSATSDLDIVQLFLKDVGKYGDLLTKAQEQSLFKQLNHYRNKKDARSQRLYKKAKGQLILHNLRLVVSHVKYYGKITGLEFSDLAMEGIEGLTKAIDKFDLKTGNKLSTYCNWWIKQAIKRSIHSKTKLIKIPDNVGEDINLVLKYNSIWTSEHQIEPTYQELADFIAKQSGKHFEATRIQELLAFNRSVVSLNKKIGADEDDQLLDFVVDDHQNPTLYADQLLKTDYLSQVLNNPLQFDNVERIYLSLTFRIKLTIPDRFKIIDDVLNHCDLERLISAEDKSYVITIVESSRLKFHLDCPCVKVINDKDLSTNQIKAVMQKCKKTKKLTLDQIKYWMQKTITNYQKLYGSTNSKDQSIYKKAYLKPYALKAKINLNAQQLKAISYQCPIWTRDRLKPIERRIRLKLENLRLDPKLRALALEEHLIY